MEQKIEAWRRENMKWIPIPLPPFEKVTAKDHLYVLCGSPVMVKFTDVHRLYYGYGNDDVKPYVPSHDGNVSMDLESFIHFWKYKVLMEIGLSLFDKVENAEERTAIMSAEGETDEAIDAYLATRPDLYERPQQQEIWPEDF